MSGNNDKSHAEMRNATWRGRLPDLLNRLGPPVPEKGHCLLAKGVESPLPYLEVDEMPIQDDTYIYVGGATTQKVYKFNKSNLTKVAESETYGGTIYSLAEEYTNLQGGEQLDDKTAVKILDALNEADVAYGIDQEDGTFYYLNEAEMKRGEAIIDSILSE